MSFSPDPGRACWCLSLWQRARNCRPVVTFLCRVGADSQVAAVLCLFVSSRPGRLVAVAAVSSEPAEARGLSPLTDCARAPASRRVLYRIQSALGPQNAEGFARPVAGTNGRHVSVAVWTGRGPALSPAEIHGVASNRRGRFVRCRSQRACRACRL